MKIKIEFDDHDEYDDLVKDLATVTEFLLCHGAADEALTTAKTLKKLLIGEIVEP